MLYHRVNIITMCLYGFDHLWGGANLLVIYFFLLQAFYEGIQIWNAKTTYMFWSDQSLLAQKV